MPNSSILIIGQHRLQEVHLAEHLRLYGGWEVICADNEMSAIEIALKKCVSIILLADASSAGESCMTVVNLRDSGVQCPVMMISENRSQINIVQGLDCGACDYVTVPFNFSVLSARIRANLRQHQESTYAMLRFGPFVLDTRRRQLIDLGSSDKVKLTEKEAQLLRELHRADEHPVSKDKLMSKVWGYSREVDSHTLETHIYRLRRKLVRGGKYEETLVTESGGYRLRGIL